jgi:hypothetical protein
MSTPDSIGPARLEDRHFIKEAILRWCRGVDRKDWDLVRTAFHPDAYDDHGMYKGDVEGLINWLVGRHPSIAFSMHSLCNVLIEFDGEDKALAESYVVAYQQYLPATEADKFALVAALGEELGARAGPVTVMMPARYVDEFERRDGAWKISRRTTVFESRYLLDTGGKLNLNPDWAVGRRDKEDPYYRIRDRFYAT